jgi:transposase InsO family protein
MCETKSSELPRREAACRRHEQRHLARQEACRQAALCAPTAASHSGSRWQDPQRSIERTVRIHAVAFLRWAKGRGLLLMEIAGVLELSPRTLRHWDLQWRTQRLDAPARGRPPARSSRQERNAVLALLNTTGPELPLEALRAQFTEMPMAELKRLLKLYRQECRRLREARPRRLYWFAPGAVWAMDFVEHLGGLSWVFSVRDLASREQLLWLQVDSPNAEVVIAALRELFRQFGPPLVLKSDNGSAFIAAVTLEFLAQHDVVPLFNPTRRPQYNGGCERGGGILKGYTHQVAILAGRPGVCLPADLEQARQLANTLSRTWGRRGPSPDDVWHTRPPITVAQREAFQDELARCRPAACQLLEYPLDQPLTRTQAARRDRRAVPAVLQALGYLKIVGRRDPLLRQPPPGQLTPAPPVVMLPAPLEEKTVDLPAAPAEKACTLEAAAAACGPKAPELNQPAQRGPAIFRVLRRSLTPLLKLLKAANIP